MNSRLNICALSVFLLSGYLSSAEKISVRALAMGGGVMPEVFLLTDEDEPFTKVQWPNRQPSERVVALRDGTLPLYHTAAGEDEKVSHTVAHEVKIPAGASEIILLGWSDGETTQYRAIADDFVGAKFNDWLLINFSTKPIALKVGDGSLPVKVASGASKIYRISAPKNKGATAVAQAPIRGEVQTFYSTYLPVKDGQRTMMFFADDGDKIRVKRIIDKLVPKKKPTG